MQLAQTPAKTLAGATHGGNGWPTLRPKGLAKMQLAQTPATFIRARPYSRQALEAFGMQDRRPASGDSPALLQAQTPASTKKWGTRSC